jgi:hypothetical protein
MDDKSYKALIISALISDIEGRLEVTEIIRINSGQSKKNFYRNINSHYSLSLHALDLLLYCSFILTYDFDENNVPNPHKKHDMKAAFNRLNEDIKKRFLEEFDNFEFETPKNFKKILQKFNSDYNRLRYPHQHLKLEKNGTYIFEINYETMVMQFVIKFFHKEIFEWAQSNSVGKIGTFHYQGRR